MATIEGIFTSTLNNGESISLTCGSSSGNGVQLVVMAAQSDFTYSVSSTSGHTWSTLRNGGGTGNGIGGRFVYIYSTPVVTSGNPQITVTWTGQGNRMNHLYSFKAIGATTAYEGDEDTETQTLPGPLTLTTDLIAEGFGTTAADVIVGVGLQNTPFFGGAGWSDFMNNYDSRFTEGSEATNSSSAQGQVSTIQILYDEVSSGTQTLDAESVDHTTNSGGSTSARAGGIRVWFDQVALSEAGWAWNGANPFWQTID